MKKLFSVLSLAVFVFLARPAQAVYFGSGEILSFPVTQTFNESVFIAGSDITVDSDIVGDLYCAGETVTINSKITGDVICAAQNLKINGMVEGNVRSVAQYISINGQIGKNITVGSQTLILDKSASISGDVFYGVQNIDLQGTMGRDLAGGSESVSITGSLLRNAKVATNKISVKDPAVLNGDLEYYIEKNGSSSINEKSVKGKITRNEVEMEQSDDFKKDIKRLTPLAIALKIAYSIFSTFLLVLLVLYFTPARVSQISSIIKSKPVKSALVGFAVLVAGPIAIILSAITVIGLSLAAVLTLFYILSLVLAFSYGVIRFSHILSENYVSLKGSIYLSAFLSSLVLGLVVHIPFLGGVISFIILLVGLGATFISYLPAEK